MNTGSRQLSRSVALLALVWPLAACLSSRPEPPHYEPVTHESGLITHDLVVPKKGRSAQLGDHATVHYSLELADGTEVDSSYARGRPVETVLGSGSLPRGVELGIVGMRRFGRRELTVPPALGYGEEGRPPTIPPNALLRFTLELMQLEAAPEAAPEPGSAPEPGT